MHETLVVALLAGCALGAVYFGGLWWTVRRGLSSEQPAPWFVGSLILRMGIALPGFYFASGGHWERLLFCLLGFATATVVVGWLSSRSGRASRPLAPEVTHAPYTR
jgi:F1F0 ATPase subunit 2